jgi:hypothetical protein
MSSYLAILEHRIQGIPCQIGVTSYYYQKPFGGSPHLCDSDWDYYGYTEIEYDVLGRKGYLANWLSKKITSNDEDNIEKAIKEYFQSED